MPNDLASFRQRLQRGDPQIRADLEALLHARREERAGHADWALLCEDAGLLDLAFREFQLAIRDEPTHPVAAFRLAQHYRERGDGARAVALLERLLATDPAHEDWLTALLDILHEDGALPRARDALQRAVRHGLPPQRARLLERAAPSEEPPSEPPDLAPTDADCVRFQALFAGREDVHARQWARADGEGGYSPVHEPLTPAVVRNHLLGSYTVGVYPIRLDGTCTFFALDLDLDRASVEAARGRPELARSLRDTLRTEAARLLAVLHDLGLRPLFEDSGYKGRHYWGFLEHPETAGVLHVLGRQFLAWQTPQVPSGLHLEFFPKQAGRAGKGLGNLIKLPLGIHRRTGRRSQLLAPNGQPLVRPLEALRHVDRCPQAALHAALERLKGQAARPGPAPEPRPDDQADPPSPPPKGPPPPPPAPAWTEADFETDPRVRHLLRHCPVLAALKQTVDEHRQLSHDEQLVLIHTLGHLDGGPQAVNYLLGRCLDVGPEKFLKGQLKGNPVSCPSIRKRIGHVTRRVACNCPFEFAPDRYPTPVLHLLTLPPPAAAVPRAAAADLEALARRYGTLERRRREIEREAEGLRAELIRTLRASAERTVVCPGGRYRLIEQGGVEELLWEEDGGEEVCQTQQADNEQR